MLSKPLERGCIFLPQRTRLLEEGSLKDQVSHSPKALVPTYMSLNVTRWFLALLSLEKLIFGYQDRMVELKKIFKLQVKVLVRDHYFCACTGGLT